MTEEGSSNSDFDLKIIQKIQCENENKMEEIKQNFKQFFVEKTTEKDKQILEKIDLTEEQIKKVNDLFDKKISDLTKKLEEFGKLTCKFVCFVQIKNKWKEIYNLNDNRIDNDFYNCCEKNCINTNKPTGNCVKGHGFVNITGVENIKYINFTQGYDKDAGIIAENKFEKPQNCINYSLFYFETTFIKNEGKTFSECWIIIGLSNNDNRIRLIANKSLIKNEKNEEFKIGFCWNYTSQVLGCGLVFPPNNKISEEFPYVFFTQNGVKIGKAVLLKDNFDFYKPFVHLKCTTANANFGHDLRARPFVYDISKHFVIKEFY
uniref:SPRY domain-containing protein n=1 Tax=Meloidogyne hapla TaxID=6305 RepID=A0A1I8C1K5_MELHA